MKSSRHSSSNTQKSKLKSTTKSITMSNRRPMIKSSLQENQKNKKPAYFHYHFLCEVPIHPKVQTFDDLKRFRYKSRFRTIIPLCEMLRKWKIDLNTTKQVNGVVTQVKFGVLRWYIEHKWKLNSETSQPIHKHLSATPEQMLVGFKYDPMKQEYKFLKESDWIHLQLDFVVFKRVDYSFLMDVVVIDERTKRRKRLLTKDAFESPFSFLLNNLPVSMTTSNCNEMRNENDEIQLIMYLSKVFSHQYRHPSEIILNLIATETENNLIFTKKTVHKLFSLNWYNILPVTFADDWMLLRDFCTTFLTENKSEDVREDWCMNEDIDLLPEMIDRYAMNLFKGKPHGLMKRHWVPLATRAAVEVIRLTIPERSTFLSTNNLQKETEFVVPNDVFYDNGRLYKVGW